MSTSNNLKKLRTKQLCAAILAVEGIGRRGFRKTLERLNDLSIPLEDFWQRKPAQIWKLCKLTDKQQSALRKFQKRFTPEGYYGWLGEQNIRVITNEDKEYPELLQQIDDKPLVLYAKGSLSGVNQRPIAVVGTRKISGYGQDVCARIVPQLVAQKASIVSGFMYGVDTCAQQQAVKHGGYTIGVLGFGFDYMYPTDNRQFFAEMLSKGNGFVTEYPPWIGSHKSNFPERNRIVAGMSRAVVVVEAAKKSGSHITAGFAGEYGRGVCAVPGPITNFYSEGTKWLINQGAKLVSSGKDILEEAGVFGSGWSKFIPEEKQQTSGQLSFADTLQEKIYHHLLNGPCSTDELARQLSLPITDLNPILSMLELEMYLEKQNDTWFAKTANSVQ
ncbi:DNA-processing protein DprA [Patescibacteria group bacterium]|nr:DNA-processing protein DprA [Patescibacteria group bacterium]MBU1885609.1 DNA-processing protein DprA [Patescibacteria group bacterium]